MRAPSFWQTRSLVAQLLRPLGGITAAVTARRVARAGLRLDIPVICVGNINAGGTGKTPTVIDLIARLKAARQRPFVISRGYGGRLVGPVLVDPAQHSAADVGDEPLLLSAFASVIVARDRAAGGRLAQSMGASVAVLDDGMQNPSLHKDLTITVVDAETGFGNGLCLPAGPLREPVAAGLARTDLLLSIGGAAAQTQFLARQSQHIAGIAHITAALAPLAMGIDWRGAKVVAFAGIGRPAKFFATLRALGAEILHTESLADHAPLPEPLLARLLSLARQNDADLVTTEKDAVRLPPRYQREVVTLPVRLTFDTSSILDAALARILNP